MRCSCVKVDILLLLYMCACHCQFLPSLSSRRRSLSSCRDSFRAVLAVLAVAAGGAQPKPLGAALSTACAGCARGVFLGGSATAGAFATLGAAGLAGGRASVGAADVDGCAQVVHKVSRHRGRGWCSASMAGTQPSMRG